MKEVCNAAGHTASRATKRRASILGSCVAPALEATCACGAYPRISVKAEARPTRPPRGRRYAFISVDAQPVARACWPSSALRTAHLDRMRPMREGYNPEGSLPRLGQREEKRPRGPPCCARISCAPKSRVQWRAKQGGLPLWRQPAGRSRSPHPPRS